MPEVRKADSLGTYVADLEKRVRYLEAIVARAAFQTVAVELANQFSLVTSGTFVPTMHANYPFISQPVLNLWVVVTSDAGTTGEVRIREFYSGAVTDALVIPGSANNFCTFQWLHGVPLGDTQCEFQIQARRTAGAGDFRVYAPRRVLFDDVTRFPDADAAGHAVLV